MKESNKLATLVKNSIIAFLIFMIGFLGTMLLVNDRISSKTTEILDSQIEITEYIKICNVNIAVVEGRYENGNFILDIIKSNYYNLAPFIVATLLLVVILILTFVTKKILNTKK